jgi:hypothetical protein
MAAPRRQRKRSLLRAVGLGLAAGGAFGLSIAYGAARPIVVNANTGLAISGFDPVAYFTDHQPEVGRPDLELRREGAVWRFVNTGNRAVFADHPEIYGPRFGGYDPVAVAKGNSVPGHPYYWAVVGQRLYLFYDAQSRTAFMAEPGRFIAAADRKWPTVAKNIVPAIDIEPSVNLALQPP